MKHKEEQKKEANLLEIAGKSVWIRTYRKNNYENGLNGYESINKANAELSYRTVNVDTLQETKLHV